MSRSIVQLVLFSESRSPGSNPVCLHGSLKGVWRLRLSGLYVTSTKPICAIESVAQSRDFQLAPGAAAASGAGAVTVTVAWSDGKTDAYTAGAIVRGRQAPDMLLQRIIKERIAAHSVAPSASSAVPVSGSRLGDLFQTLSEGITFALKLTPSIVTTQGGAAADAAAGVSSQQHVQNCILAILREQQGSSHCIYSQNLPGGHCACRCSFASRLF